VSSAWERSEGKESERVSRAERRDSLVFNAKLCSGTLQGQSKVYCQSLEERGVSSRREINAVPRGTSEFDAERGNSIIRWPPVGARVRDRVRLSRYRERQRGGEGDNPLPENPRAINGASRADSIAVIKFMAELRNFASIRPNAPGSLSSMKRSRQLSSQLSWRTQMLPYWAAKCQLQQETIKN